VNWTQLRKDGGTLGVVLYACEHNSKHVQQKILVQHTVSSAQLGSMYCREILDSSVAVDFPGCAGICQTAEISGLDSYLGLFLAGTERVCEVLGSHSRDYEDLSSWM
jgi:hypothetical protein